jgi:hypothetical protein
MLRTLFRSSSSKTDRCTGDDRGPTRAAGTAANDFPAHNKAGRTPLTAVRAAIAESP